mmetsp:Transcript_34057/g.110023  ORF Transcript_34057/g.110023 Transcript_34057/m.110023 type:complete len:209 (+) Transcript_34057:524-1150(+)
MAECRPPRPKKNHHHTRATWHRLTAGPGPPSRQVLIHAPVAFVALQELALDERLDPLFDDVGVRHEAGRQLRRHVRDERVVLHVLARLHDAHDGGLDLRLAVLLHLLPRLLLLRLRFLLSRYSAHLEPQLLGGEVMVEGEGIVLANLPAARLLVDELEPSAGQALQGALEVVGGDGGVGGDVGVGEGVGVVEEEKDTHHVGGHVDLVP